MTETKLNQYRDENTREIEMPDGSMKAVRMTPLLWDNLQFLHLIEGISTPEIANFALEEVALQGETFDRAFRGVVAHLANRWT